ncbi:ABC transporter substrate-binding protein [Dactylosporangium sp. CA-092794]|uniref:ABC transporter substrate-binding protein n=1 Tax=Dactylosporangium sp. CA-092794 TaxID=3239929 RepID=UPI003D8C260D
MAAQLDRRRFLGLGAGALGAALLAACSGGKGPGGRTAGGATGPTGSPVRGGTLTFSDTEAVSTWQPQKLGTYSSGNVSFHTNVFLLYFDPYQKKLQPWVAESWSKNDENTKFSFRIRKGITFIDGTQLTPEIVAKNYELYGRGDQRLRVPVHPQVSRGFDHVEVDGDTVTVVLSKPNQQFLIDTTRLNSPILGAKTLGLDLEEAGLPQNSVGAGPFVFESQVPNQSAVLVRRPGYRWAPASSPNQGEAYLDRIVWKVLPEIGLRTGALTSRQVDVARGIQPADESVIKAAGYQLLLYRPPLGTSNYAALRVENEFTKDPLVRRALVLGVDRDGLTRDALTDSYPPPISILNVDNPNAIDLSAEFKYDPGKARDLLEQAGWRQGADGVRAKDGKQLHLTVPQSAQQVALGPAWEYIAQQWRKELGIVLDVRNDPSFAATANTDVTVPIVVSRTSIISLGQSFGGPGNTALLGAPPELVALYRRELEAKDDAEFKAVQAEQQRALHQGSYVIAYFEEAQTFGASPDVHVTFQTQTYPDFYNAWKRG